MWCERILAWFIGKRVCASGLNFLGWAFFPGELASLCSIMPQILRFVLGYLLFSMGAGDFMGYEGCFSLTKPNNDVLTF